MTASVVCRELILQAVVITARPVQRPRDGWGRTAGISFKEYAAQDEAARIERLACLEELRDAKSPSALEFISERWFARFKARRDKDSKLESQRVAEAEARNAALHPHSVRTDPNGFGWLVGITGSDGVFQPVMQVASEEEARALAKALVEKH